MPGLSEPRRPVRRATPQRNGGIQDQIQMGTHHFQSTDQAKQGKTKTRTRRIAALVATAAMLGANAPGLRAQITLLNPNLNTTALVALTYTVSYNANGGSGAPASQSKTSGVTLALSGTKPTRTGYSFLGWSTSSTATAATYAAGASYTANAAATLYAVWQATYTVAFNLNGASGALASQVKTDGVTMTLSSAIPTRTGYNFLGWSTSSTATTPTYAAGVSYTVNAATTLYAVWKANTYTVAFNANNGSGAPASQTKTYDANLTLTGAQPSRTGYSFQGWSTSSTATAATYAAGGNFASNITAATTLYAVWKANTYTVAFNANNGSGAPASQSKTYDANLILNSAVPVRAGYTFQGWATSSAATTPAYSAGASFNVNITAAVTLYAVWKANTYTVAYNLNGADGTPPASQIKTHGINLTLSNTIPECGGFSFLGWSLTPDATTADYAAGGTYTLNMGATLHAVWLADVTVDINSGYSPDYDAILTLMEINVGPLPVFSIIDVDYEPRTPDLSTDNKLENILDLLHDLGIYTGNLGNINVGINGQIGVVSDIPRTLFGNGGTFDRPSRGDPLAQTLAGGVAAAVNQVGQWVEVDRKYITPENRYWATFSDWQEEKEYKPNRSAQGTIRDGMYNDDGTIWGADREWWNEQKERYKDHGSVNTEHPTPEPNENLIIDENQFEQDIITPETTIDDGSFFWDIDAIEEEAQGQGNRFIGMDENGTFVFDDWNISGTQSDGSGTQSDGSGKQSDGSGGDDPNDGDDGDDEESSDDSDTTDDDGDDDDGDEESWRDDDNNPRGGLGDKLPQRPDRSTWFRLREKTGCSCWEDYSYGEMIEVKPEYEKQTLEEPDLSDFIPDRDDCGNNTGGTSHFNANYHGTLLLSDALLFFNQEVINPVNGF